MKTINIVHAAVVGIAGLAALGSAHGQQTDQSVQFPDLASSYLKTGDFIGPDHPTRIRPGLNKDQVRLELGNPHFSEGIFGVSEWDYAFNFYTGRGNEYITCQFKVKFDKVDGMYRVTSTHWKGAACPPPAAPAMVASPGAPAAPAAPQAMTLNTDGLFRFDGGRESDLLPDGPAKVRALAQQVKANMSGVQQVVVTGHTDRLGSEAYNQELSLARANTVRDLIAREGVDPARIRTVGIGEKNPVVTDCSNTLARAALISCLAPNRRVEVQVVPAQ